MLGSLFGSSRGRFLPLEGSVLDAVAAGLEHETRSLFRRQIESVNLIQRHRKNREVNCYSMAKGRPAWDPSLRMKVDAQEYMLAEVRFKVPSNTSSLTAKVFLVDGFIFSIEFDGDVEAISFVGDIDIEQCRIFGGRSLPNAVESEGVKLGGWVGDLARRYGSARVRPPFTADPRSDWINKYAGLLPAEYLEFIDQANGAEIGDASVLGLDELYIVSAEAGEILILCQLNGLGLIASRKFGEKAEVFRVDYSDSGKLEAVSSFRDALVGYLKSEYKGKARPD
jgi:hypothetical protein